VEQSGALKGILALDELEEPVVLVRKPSSAHREVLKSLFSGHVKNHVESIIDEQGVRVLALKSLGNKYGLLYRASRSDPEYVGDYGRGHGRYIHCDHFFSSFAFVVAKSLSLDGLTFRCFRVGEDEDFGRCVALPLRRISSLEGDKRLTEVAVSLFRRRFKESEAQVLSGLLKEGEVLYARGMAVESVCHHYMEPGHVPRSVLERLDLYDVDLFSVDLEVFRYFEADLRSLIWTP